jgi:hypothetical protein
MRKSLKMEQIIKQRTVEDKLPQDGTQDNIKRDEENMKPKKKKKQWKRIKKQGKQEIQNLMLNLFDKEQSFKTR